MRLVGSSDPHKETSKPIGNIDQTRGLSAGLYAVNLRHGTPLLSVKHGSGSRAVELPEARGSRSGAGVKSRPVEPIITDGETSWAEDVSAGAGKGIMHNT